MTFVPLYETHVNNGIPNLRNKATMKMHQQLITLTLSFINTPVKLTIVNYTFIHQPVINVAPVHVTIPQQRNQLCPFSWQIVPNSTTTTTDLFRSDYTNKLLNSLLYNLLTLYLLEKRVVIPFISCIYYEMKWNEISTFHKNEWMNS